MSTVAIDSSLVRVFCEKHHVLRLSLFGSALHGDMSPESDVDLLVEFDPEHVPGLLRLVAMEEELAATFGRRVDLRTPQELSRSFRDRVVREARPLYEAA